MFRIFSQYVSRKTLLFLIADAALITAAIVAGFKLRYFNNPESFRFYTALPDFGYRVLAIIICFQLCSYYNELYSPHTRSSVSDQFFRLSQALGAGCLLLAVLYFMFPALQVGRSSFAVAVVLMLALITGFRWVVDVAWHTALPRDNVLVLGAEKLATDIAREIDLRQDLNMQVVGFAAPEAPPAAAKERVFGRQILGTFEDLEEIVNVYRIRKVVVALEEQRGVLPVRQLLRLRTRGIQIEDAHSTMSALTGRIPLETVRSTWFIFSDGFRRSRYSMAIKRLLDIVISVSGVILTAPVMAVVAIAVKLDSPGPALFRQRRVGLNGKCFEVVKFRTMRQDAEADGIPRWAEQDDPRATRLGKILRKYRFDELPQFFNVLRGEMSFVGPRPERPEFVEKLREAIPFYDERHSVRPGVTGWAQICYPYGSTIEDALHKLEYDLFYLKNVSVLFDLAIVFQTVKTILWGRGQ